MTRYSIQVPQSGTDDLGLFDLAVNAFGNPKARGPGRGGRPDYVWDGLTNIQNRYVGDPSDWIATSPDVILWLQMNTPAGAKVTSC